MELITRKQRAADAARAWKHAYFSGGNWERVLRGCACDTHKRLVALGDSPTPEEVDEVIGNGSWTSLRCDECKRQVEAAVMVGDEPDYESNTAWVCVDCLKKALDLAAGG